VREPPKLTRTSDIIHAMRPFQRDAAELLVADVLAGNPPKSVEDAQARYRDLLGDGFWIDNGKSWRDDIRDTSVYLLIKNGFAKSKTVKLSKDTNVLTDWVFDKERLDHAARLETEHGGNLRQTRFRDELIGRCIVSGTGDQAVYLYTDDLLDRLGFSCSKIGRHLSSEIGSVVDRVLAQYGTGSAGFPVLRHIFRTGDSIALETELHRIFRNRQLKEAYGTEWFKVGFEEVAENAEKLIDCPL